MKTKTPNNKEKRNPNRTESKQAVQFKDNREQTQNQVKVQTMANEAVQRKENKTGMPDQLKSGIEGLSGMDMSDVRVHYNSSRPAQLQAHAYAQANQIHVAPGQERHLPHEAWHVVQQKQGRVHPTTQLMGKVQINDSSSLEKEADVMGAKAMQLNKISSNHTVQQKVIAYQSNDLNLMQRSVIQLDRADNLYHKSSYDPGDGRTTNLNAKNNTAHHIVPHSSLKKVYESIADSSVNRDLRVKTAARFIPGTVLSTINTKADDYIKAVDALADPIPVNGDAPFSAATVTSGQLKGTVTAPTNKEAFKGAQQKTFDLTQVPSGAKRTENTSQSINLIKNANFSVPLPLANGSVYDGKITTTKNVEKADALEENKYFTAPVIKEVNSYLEWAKGNQFYGPNANDRFETDKEAVDVIGDYHIEFGRHKGQDGLDYVKEHANNLGLLNGSGGDKIIYADNIKKIVSAKIRDLRKKKSEDTNKKNDPIWDGKITKRYERLKRLYEISPNVDIADITVGNDPEYKKYVDGKLANTADHAIKEERLVEQAKIGKMVANKDNRYVAEHWVKIDTDEKAAAVKQLHAGGGPHVNTTAKKGKYIHFSEILNKTAPVWVADGGILATAIASAYGNLKIAAETARSTKIVGQKQLDDLIRDDLNSLTDTQIKSVDTSSISKGSLNKLFTNKYAKLSLDQKREAELPLLDGTNLTKLLETKANYPFNKEHVGRLSVTNVEAINNTAINLLVHYHFKDLSNLVKNHIKQEDIKDNNLFELKYPEQKEWVDHLIKSDFNSITDKQLKRIDTASISQDSLNKLFTDKYAKLSLDQKREAELTLLNGTNLTKLLETKANYYFNKGQVGKLTVANINDINNDAINLLVQYHFKDLSNLVKDHIKQEDIKDNNLFELKYPEQKEWVDHLITSDFNSITDKQLKRIDTASISQASLNKLFTDKYAKLTLTQKQKAELSLLNGPNLTKLLETKANYYFDKGQIGKLTVVNITSISNDAINWLVYYHSKDLSTAVKDHIIQEHASKNNQFRPWYSMQKNWIGGGGKWKYL